MSNWARLADARPYIYRNHGHAGRAGYSEVRWKQALQDFFEHWDWSVRGVEFGPRGSVGDPWACDNHWPAGIRGPVNELVARVLSAAENELPGIRALLWLYCAEQRGRVAESDIHADRRGRIASHVQDQQGPGKGLQQRVLDAVLKLKIRLRGEYRTALGRIPDALEAFAQHWCRLVPTHAQEVARREYRQVITEGGASGSWPGCI